MRSRGAWLGLCFAFGAVIETIKAPEGWPFEAFRFQLGNVSTVWLAVPLLCGYLFKASGSRVVLPLVSTLTALAGFYSTMVFMFPHAWGSGGVPSGFQQSFRAGAIWLAAGIVAAPLAGPLGARLPNVSSVVAVVGSLLLLEPLAMFAASYVTIPVINLRWWFEWGAFAYGEMVLGALLFGIWGYRARSIRDGAR